MTDNIFGTYAPLYYEKNLSVIPLKHYLAKSKDGKTSLGKAPAISTWSQWANKPIPPALQAQWLNTFSNNNIGIALGPQSGVMIVDIDVEDEGLQRVIQNCLPKSPWVRTGKKGCAIAYRYNPAIHEGKGFKIYEHGSDHPLVEILSEGQQVVLPPSIHPETLKPYTATSNLYEVVDNLPPLPNDIEERLRSALSNHVELRSKKESFAISAKVSLGSRDTALTRFAGLCALYVLKGERTLKDALRDIQAWVENNVAQVEGDQVSFEKGQSNLIKFLQQDTSKGRLLPVGWDEGLTEKEKIELGFVDDSEEWEYNRIISYLSDVYGSSSSNEVTRTAATQKVLSKLAISESLNQLEVSKIMKFMSENSGDKLPVGVYQKSLKELKRGELAGVNHTEIAVEALKEYQERVGTLRVHNGFFWCYNGSHWEKLDEDPELFKFVAERYGHLDAAKKKPDHKGIISVMKSLAEQGLEQSEGVNFANGFLTKELKLLPHSPDHGMTYTMDFEYKPEIAGKCPKFFKYLQDSWGHQADYEQKVECLRQMYAATIFGVATKFQRAFLLHGMANTGKSQLLEILSRLLPPEAQVSISPELWKERYTLINLTGKLLNVCGELPDNMLIAGKQFKEVVVGDPVTDRDLHKSFISFRPRTAHWFSSNHLPRSRDVSKGFTRRWLILHFDRKPDTVIRDLAKIIVEEEIEALAAWAIESFPTLEEQGEYTIPSSHEELIGEISEGNSTVRQFLSDMIIEEEGSSITLEEAYKAYWSYASMELSSGTVKRSRFLEEMKMFLAEDGYRAFYEKKTFMGVRFKR